MKFLFRTLALLTGILLLCAAYSGWLDPRVWALPAVLGLAFPLVLAFAALVAVLCLIFRQWRALLVLGVSLLLAWPTVRLHTPLSGNKTVADSLTTFRVMTYNVYGFDGDGATMRYILKQDADFVLLQEASWGPMDFIDLPCHVDLREDIERQYPFHSQGYHDLIILSKVPYNVVNDTTLKQGVIADDEIDMGYHFYGKAFDVTWAGQPLRIVSTHLQSIGMDHSDRQLYRRLTNNDLEGRADMSRVKNSLIGKLKGAYVRRAAEAQAVRTFINDTTTANSRNLVLCGDFNDTPASYCYRTIRGDDLQDAFAECGWGPTFTFNRDRLYFKIDHILYRGNLQAVNYLCDREGQSDHYPQVVTFVLTKHE